MEWNRRNIIGAIVILVLGFGSGGVIYVHQEGGWRFAMFRLEKSAGELYGEESEMTAEEERVARREAERIREVILEKYPSLRLEEKEVSAELNGYLALFELAGDSDLQSLMNSEILDQVSEEKIDPTVIRKGLAAFDAIGKEIERIAALPERSNVIDGKLIDQSFPAREVKTMGDYLVIKALLAAMDGDEAESFRFLSLAVNLSEHLGGIESPHFLSEVVRIGVRCSIRKVSFQDILPTLGKSTDLLKWESILRPQTEYPQRYGHLLKGEFIFLNEALLNVIFVDVPDPEQTAMAYANWVEASMNRYDKMSLDQAEASEYLLIEQFSKGISREGISLLKGIIIGSSMLRSILGTLVMEYHQAAALDLLIREQKGEDLSKLTETFLLNPYTGKPFAYDAATRTLTTGFGTKHTELDELKLPW